MLRVFLEKNGYKVIEAKNGLEALEIAKSAKPDLIMMDLSMPELDGLSATRQIRQYSDLREIPILTNSGDGINGMNLFLNIEEFGDGYIEYIPKPINLNTLRELIKTILSKVKKAA